MCHKQAICPEFERRTINGIKGACSNCEYVKRFARTARWSRVGLVIAIIGFIISTYIVY